jgi:hypothetical protein
MSDEQKTVSDPKGSAEEGIWHPFETAPKDGTILQFEDAYGERMDVARWSQGEWTSVFGEMEEGVMVRWRLAGI